MSEFVVVPLKMNSVAYVNRMRSSIQLDPVYQRQGEVWSRAKQALLIDSIINQFDIPKIYFHQHARPIEVNGKKIRYSLVDGRQRLEAIWDFIDGRFALAPDFKLIETGSTSAAGMTFSELEAEEDDIAALFSASQIDIWCIQTDDIDLIEEMFSRLNEAVPLSAAEKRNGRGGPLRGAVRSLCEDNFFVHKLPFGNKRYRHYDLATKFLIFSEADGAVDTKKRQLDEFWERFKVKDDKLLADSLEQRVKRAADKMSGTFEDGDRLLGAVGMISVYFLYYLGLENTGARTPLRSELVAFEDVRKLNRYDDEMELNSHQRKLLEFDRFAQSPNDSSALSFRLGLLKEFLADPEVFKDKVRESAG